MRFSTIALALFASAAPALGAPWRLRAAGVDGVIGVIDPVGDDDCGQTLDANSLAMKVSSLLPGAPLCAPAGTSPFKLIVNGVTIATNVAIIGQCADCTGVNDIDVSPVLMQLIKGGGPDNTDNTAIAAEIQVDFS